MEVKPHKVLDIVPAAEGLFELVLERGDYQFTVGDCAALHNDNGQSRPYSIASGIDEDVLRFVIWRIRGGEVSPWLMDRKAGDEVIMSHPFGWFRPGQDINDSPFIFIATGTGIAPFLSFSRSFQHKPEKILYGARTLRHSAIAHSLKDWCEFEIAVSREEVENIHHGRVTDLLEKLPLNDRTHYYLCGLDSMINDVSSWLEKQGVLITHIHREVFFND